VAFISNNPPSVAPKIKRPTYDSVEVKKLNLNIANKN